MANGQNYNSDEFGQIGIIERVNLRNFMCHDNLCIDFDPHLNFITGRNGSGKSAVLTGIILALGGKSGATGRYSNIKGFIKEGKNIATVCVTLKNCGPDAYKPNQYGPKITIERWFNRIGNINYKIKSHSGQVISTSKEELNNILTIMDIQIENPVAVLTQEICRNFLVSETSKSRKLFQFFYNGTGLARVEEDYIRSEQQTQDTNDELNLKKSALPDMEKGIKKLRDHLDRSAKIVELNVELQWARVIEAEKERSEEVESLQRVTGEIALVKKKIDSYKVQKVKCLRKISDEKSSKKISTETMNALRQEVKTHASKQSELISLSREKKGELSRYQREVKKISAEASSIQKVIDKIKIKNQNDESEHSQRHSEKIGALKEKCEACKCEMNTTDARKEDYLRTLGVLNDEMEFLHAEIQGITNQITYVSMEKQNLIDGIKNRIGVFGPEMKHLLNDIERAYANGLFRVKPKGPIGLYLDVKEQEWSIAVQECLKMRTLRTFCCDNHEDANQLKNIINKLYAKSHSKPSVVTTKFSSEVYDVSQYKTQSEHPTVLDMVEIKDSVIANCLIDQNKIENILLVADQKVAQDLMLDTPPRNCNSTFTLNGDQIYSNPYRYYSNRNINQPLVLKSVNQDDVSKKDQELQHLNDQLQQKKSVRENFAVEFALTERQLEQNESKSTELRIHLKQLQSQISEEENTQAETKDINHLENDLDNLLKERTKYENQLNLVQEEVTSLEEELCELERSITNCEKHLDEEQEAFQISLANIDEYESKRATLDFSIGKLESQLKFINDSQKKSEEKLDEICKAIEILARTAENVGPRVATTRKPEAIKKILKATEEVQEAMKYNQKTITLEYAEKVEKYNEAKKELEKQEKTNKRIEKMMEKRLIEFKALCTSSITALTCSFVILLNENNFSGYPKVDLEKQTLEIVARPKKGPSNNRSKKQNLHELSGGERAYVTIAFLLALWKRIHMPFRILDEFNVFMDSNNQHVSVNLLVNAARADKKIQYIFLSPHDLPSILNPTDAKVYKMDSPKR